MEENLPLKTTRQEFSQEWMMIEGQTFEFGKGKDWSKQTQPAYFMTSNQLRVVVAGDLEFTVHILRLIRQPDNPKVPKYDEVLNTQPLNEGTINHPVQDSGGYVVGIQASKGEGKVRLTVWKRNPNFDPRRFSVTHVGKTSN